MEKKETNASVVFGQHNKKKTPFYFDEINIAPLFYYFSVATYDVPYSTGVYQGKYSVIAA
jgi:hypothetical protein